MRPSVALAACRTLVVDSENRPQRGHFLPDSPPHSPAMGQESGEKWTAAVDLQPTIPKSDRLLEHKRIMVRETPRRFRATNPRIFGSVLHGNDRDGSDLDLLVDALPGATLFDLGGLQVELESLLGVSVDVLTPDDLPAGFRAKVLAEAQWV